MSAAPDVPEDSSQPLARAPLAHWHARHGARFDEINSWQVPAVYTDENREVVAAQSGVAMADLSSITKIMLRGPGVAELIQVLTGDSAAATSGGVAPLTSDKSVLACRLHVDQLLLLDSPMGSDKLEQVLAAREDGVSSDLIRWSPARQLLETDVTSAFACFWLVGPRTDELLRQLTHFDLNVAGKSADQAFCAETGLAGMPALLVRPPTVVLASMRILVGCEVAEYVWEKLFQLGQASKMVPIGFDALETLAN